MGIKDIIKKYAARKRYSDALKRDERAGGEEAVERYKAKEIGLRKRIAGLEEIKRIKALEEKYHRMRSERTRELGKAFVDVGVKIAKPVGKSIKGAVKKAIEKGKTKPPIPTPSKVYYTKIRKGKGRKKKYVYKPIPLSQSTAPAEPRISPEARPVPVVERKPEVREEISLLTGKPIKKTEKEKSFL